MDHKSWRTVRRAGGLGWARSLKLATMFFILAVAVGSGTLVPRPTEAGDGTCVVDYDLPKDRIGEITFNCTATSEGGYTAAVTKAVRGLVISAISDPGATAPTDLWDATVTESGVDIFCTALSNQSHTLTRHIFPLSSTAGSDTYSPVVTTGIPVNGALTLGITNNSAANATLLMRIRGFFR